MTLIECIPNFSEGRRPSVLNALRAALSVPGLAILDVHSDSDHNRSVFTLAGDADAITAAMLDATRVAVQMIDMRQHTGVHPRIGAVDVVPFVPLGETLMDTCITIARAFGKRVASTLDIPVYFYENAAIWPERKRLSEVRRGQYEGLAAAIALDPARAPDEGPARMSTAGAMAVGARGPLIAYNVFLAAADVQVAKRIASAVRESNGGLAGVRALGLIVDGRAQVSMNLTDFRATPVPLLMAHLHRAAQREGTTLSEGELVGLIPEAALEGTSLHDMLLADREDPVLEHRLRHFL